MRTTILVLVLLFLAGLLGLTVSVTARDGVDVLTALSILVLALLGIGIVGALRDPPGR